MSSRGYGSRKNNPEFERTIGPNGGVGYRRRNKAAGDAERSSLGDPVSSSLEDDVWGDGPKVEDVAKVDDVFASAADPRLAALPDGSVLLDRDDDAVIKRDEAWSGAGYVSNESKGEEFGPWWVVCVGQGGDPKVEDVFASAADPRLAALPDGSIMLDRDNDAVIKQDGAWSGAGYPPKESEGNLYGPWRVIYTGQGDGPKVEDVVKVDDVFASADDPRLAALPDGSILLDREDDAIIKRDGAWSGAGYVPNESEGNGPWRVDYIGQGDDQ